MTSFGVNILGALYWSFSVPRSEVTYLSSAVGERYTNAMSSKVPRGRLWHVLLACGYTCLHSSLLMLHLVVFQV